MLDRTTARTTERVAKIVQRLLAKRNLDRPIGYDDDLGESGLSSLDFVNLMLAIETEFDVKIPERDMIPGNFRSLARIDALIARVSSEVRAA